MKHPVIRRGALGLVAGALTLAGLAGVPSPARAAVDWGQVSAGVDFNTWSAPPLHCQVVGGGGADALDLQDNGVPVSQSWSATATVVDTTTDAVVTDLAASSQITGSITPIGAGPATIKATFSATASANPRGADSDCGASVSGSPGLGADFTLPQPMWATISGTGEGSGVAQAVVFVGNGSGGGLVLGPRGHGSSSILLPAGEVQVQIEARADVSATDTVLSRSYAGSVTIDLQPLGTASAPTGNGKGLVLLGGRDCASGNVNVDLAKKARKKAKQITISVNGAQVAKLKGKKKLKARTLAVPAARGADAEVAVRIKLKNGKQATLTRSYLACA